MNIGLFIIFIGILCNEFTLRRFLLQKGVIGPFIRIELLIFEALLILAGLFIVKLDNKTLVFIKSRSRTITLLFGLYLIVFALVSAEIGLHITENLKRPRYGNIDTSGLVYTVDEYKRRVTPLRNQDGRDRYALFFGCSCMFGLGVKDDETMPFYFGEAAGRYRPYNYGRGGTGPAYMLETLQREGFAREIPEREGILVYNFWDDHVNRTIGRMSVVGSWGSELSCYSMDKKGELRKEGTFMSARPFLTRLYIALLRFHSVRALHINLPPRITDKHIRLTGRVIEESRNIFNQKFKNGKFFVILCPGQHMYSHRLEPYLKKAGIEYLDYTDLLDFPKREFCVSKYDRHPAPRAYEIMADRLARDMAILKD